MSPGEPPRDFSDRSIRQTLHDKDNLREFLRAAFPQYAANFLCEQARYLEREFIGEDWRGVRARPIPSLTW